MLILRLFIFLQGSDCHDEQILSPIAFEISSNASKFAAFSAIRSLVLEHETKYNTLYKLENKLKSIENQSRSRSEDDGNDCKSIDALLKTENKIIVPFVSIESNSLVLSIHVTHFMLSFLDCFCWNTNFI